MCFTVITRAIRGAAISGLTLELILDMDYFCACLRVWSERYNKFDVHLFGEIEGVQRLHLHVQIVFATANRRVRRMQFIIATFTLHEEAQSLEY